MIAKSRGSRPFSDETERSARVIRAFAMRWMPSAASSTAEPERLRRSRSTAASASSRRIVICPSATWPAGMKPSTTFASVTVGSTPPRP